MPKKLKKIIPVGLVLISIVDWNAMQEVSSPVVEAIMITTQMNQGISFTTTGKIIKKYGTANSY